MGGHFPVRSTPFHNLRTLWYIGTGPGRQSPAAGGPPITAETTEHNYTLSVVDQSPVRSGGTAGDALRETIALAQAAESFGFARYWVTEHHNLGNLAGTSPEMMVGQILANTSTIRVGSAGVMLPHYSSLKVAENFRVLEALYPGRIDLGVGRAPGSDQRTNAALSYPRPPNDVRHYPRQVVDLLGYLNDSLEEEHPFAVVRAGPGISTAPQVWLLGSRVDSAAMAADMGLPFSYAHFFGLSVEHGPMIADMYRANFKPSEYLAEPLVNVTLQVLCAETKEKAEELALSRNLARVKSVQGSRTGVPSIEEALEYEYNPQELAYIESLKANYVDGEPPEVRERIEALAADYKTTDVGIVTMCYDFADRVKSYELVAKAFGMI